MKIQFILLVCGTPKTFHQKGLSFLCYPTDIKVLDIGSYHKRILSYRIMYWHTETTRHMIYWCGICLIAIPFAKFSPCISHRYLAMHISVYRLRFKLCSRYWKGLLPIQRCASNWTNIVSQSLQSLFSAISCSHHCPSWGPSTIRRKNSCSNNDNHGRLHNMRDNMD